MILSLFLRNSIIFFNNFFSLLQIITTKSIKKIFLFILLYIFLNLYLLPTFALCEIDFDLLDRESNMYKGSKIVYETPEAIVTQDDLDYAKHICDIVIVISAITILITLPIFIYSKMN